SVAARDQVLDYLQFAALVAVGDGADDIVAIIDRHAQRSSPIAAGDHAAAPIVGLAADAAGIAAQARASPGRLADLVGGGTHDLPAGRAAVTHVGRGADRGRALLDEQVELARIAARDQVLDHLQPAAMAVGDGA